MKLKRARRNFASVRDAIARYQIDEPPFPGWSRPAKAGTHTPCRSFERGCSMTFAQQLRSVVMGPCVRRDDVLRDLIKQGRPCFRRDDWVLRPDKPASLALSRCPCESRDPYSASVV